MNIRLALVATASPIFIAGLAAMVGVPSVAVAQQSPEAQFPQNTTLETVVVTARRRSEPLMKVPVAVNVVSSKTIENTGAKDLQSIALLTPQVTVTKADSGNGAVITIRGVGTPATDAAVDQSVAIVIDGVPEGRGNLIDQAFFDLQQAEVLKGPQALYFGKNSPAGVISLTSVGPSDHLSGYLKYGHEFDADQNYVEGAIGGPITDQFKARIALRGSEMVGWMTNIAPALSGAQNYYYPNVGTPLGPRHNGGQNFSGRGTFVYTPNDKFDATLKISGGTHSDNGTSEEAYCPGSKVFVTQFGPADPYSKCTFNNKYMNPALAPSVAAFLPGSRNGQPYADTFATLTSLTLNYRLNGLTLTSVTGSTQLGYDLSSSFAYASFGNTWSVIQEGTHAFSQELRVVSDYASPLNFTAGAYYEQLRRQSGVNITAGTLTLFGLLAPDPVTGSPEAWQTLARDDSSTYSAFAQARYKLLPQLELDGGARYTYETKTDLVSNVYANPGQAAFLDLASTGTTINAPYHDDNWSPEVTLNWTPFDSTLVYAAYKTGYKSGGISNPSRLSAGTTAESLTYRPETTQGGEVGLKTYLAHRTVRLEATAYIYDYKNLQVSAFDELSQTSTLINAGEARTQGVELEGEWALTPQLRLVASATYNDAYYISYPNSLCWLGQTVAEGCVGGTHQSLAGQALTRAPKTTASIAPNYDISIAQNLRLGLDASVSYSDAYQTEEDNNPLTKQSAFWLVNAGARLYQSDRSGWQLAFIGRNLANVYYRTLCNPSSPAGMFSCAFPRGRELTLETSFRF